MVRKLSFKIHRHTLSLFKPSVHPLSLNMIAKVEWPQLNENKQSHYHTKLLKSLTLLRIGKKNKWIFLGKKLMRGSFIRQEYKSYSYVERGLAMNHWKMHKACQ